ncbi:DUF6457 domain-containing protein [Agromyces sp. MMS24-K17]|uniref:DUF6457 domain-containing protein n=1 Tax=Agromyces sp. MMS24-K17 TaxID=3372850 RepID=UPI003754045B
MSEPTRTPADLDAWAAQVATVLGVAALGADVGAVLDLARDAAHGVARPAAPLTTYLVGLAVGRGLPFDEAVARVAAELPETES